MSFQDDPYVHGLACGMEQDFNIDKDVYLLLVNGGKAYIDRCGNFNPYNTDFVAGIMPEVMPGGIPTAFIEAVQDETDKINGEPIPESEHYASFQNSEDRHNDEQWKVEDMEIYIDDLTTRYPPDETSGKESFIESML